MAIVLDEPQADACIAALEADDNILISAGTVAEALASSLISRRRLDLQGQCCQGARQRTRLGSKPARVSFMATMWPRFFYAKVSQNTS